MPSNSSARNVYFHAFLLAYFNVIMLASAFENGSWSSYKIGQNALEGTARPFPLKKIARKTLLRVV